jgi:tripartite-type tricarboxylate transporter receptor subunit TctC
LTTALAPVAATARQYSKDGWLRFLAATWNVRLSSMPDVPTFDEAGIKKFKESTEQGIILPAGTPKDVVLRINQEVAKFLDTAAAREKLEPLGNYPMIKIPDEFKACVGRQRQQAMSSSPKAPT